MLLVANLANTKICKKPRKITETLANGYSSESTRQELSNEYQDDRVSMVYEESCILVLWTKVVSALEGLTPHRINVMILMYSNLQPLFECTVI